MGVPQVRVVASWDGWCGTCRAERPLVLTRTGRRGLRSWWAGAGLDDLPLTLTCRLCGVGVDVPPHEEDDPEVVITADAHAPDDAEVATPAPTTAGQQAVVDALAALLRARTAAAVPAARASVDDVPWPAPADDVLDLLAAGLPALVPERA